MAGNARKWFIGCGIGCGLFIIILGGVGTCGYFGVRRIVDKAENLEDGFEALDAMYGEVAEFTPPPLGAIPSQRMEVFLTVRERMTPVREDVSGLFLTLDGKGSGGVVGKIKAGIRFIPSMLEFIAERNRVMIAEGMGIGEYQHVYCLSYYALLNKDPADGPGFTISDDDDQDEGGFRWGGNFGDDDEEDVRYRREKDLRRMINEIQRDILTNQLAGLERMGVGGQGGELWLGQLRAEVEAMRREHLRLPWEEGLPDRIRDSLAPYRSELEATYDPMTSLLEIGLVDHE